MFSSTEDRAVEHGEDVAQEQHLPIPVVVVAQAMGAD
tara:strand:+ start:325 stop:435 length:111 start_codon:yes stop_codon:yes gene_type:complete